MQFCYSRYIHREMRERRPDSGKHLSLNHDQAHIYRSGIVGGAKVKRTHLSTLEEDIYIF